MKISCGPVCRCRQETAAIRRRRGQVCCRHRIRLENLGTAHTTDTSHPHLKPYLTESDPASFALDESRLIKDDYEIELYETRRQNHRQPPFSSNVSPPYRNQGNTHPRRVHVPRLTTRRKTKATTRSAAAVKHAQPYIGSKRRRHYPEKEISIDRCGAEWSAMPVT